jgi:uncharacterized protein (DUF2141 family)
MSRLFSKNRTNPFKHQRTRLHVEALEDRALPSGNTISGFVFYDANANGLMDSGELGLANSTVELHNASNQVIGTAITDSAGHYLFTTDQTNLSIDKTLTKTVTFPSTQTNFDLSGVLAQFDPSLGQLQSVEIQHAGSITSEIKVENLSTDSPSHITGNVSGTMNLVAPGVNDNLAISGYAGSFDALKYDGVTDFGGTSGTSFGQKTANGSNTIMVTDPSQVAAYVGTGTVNVTEKADATSNATGGGNLEVNVDSTAQATVTVIYHYKAAGPLLPGSYTLVQTKEPIGYVDGLDSHQGVVIPNSIGTDTIPVTLTNNDSPANNFGELKSTSIAGHVYYDANNNGKFDSTETGIASVTLTLTGPGGPVTATTDSSGAYSFNHLTPGTYTVAETQPANYLNGTDTAGTNGGTVHNVPGDENINTIALNNGDSAQNYDFGELKPASLAGNVYVDAKNSGQLDPGDPPIAGDTITLTGANDQVPFISVPTTTAADGSYSFTNLRPGTYAITQTPPAGYTDAATTVGSQGGTKATDVVSDIKLNAGVDGVNNNFGELKTNPPTPPAPLPKDAILQGMLPVISKTQLTVNPTLANIDPTLRGQMAFAVGANITLTGQQLDLAGTMNAVQQLETGTTPQAYVAQLWTTDAHRALQADTVYQSILNRAPTSQEQAAATQQLNAGTSVTALMLNLYTSPEFQQQHAGTQALAVALSEGILNTAPGSVASQALVQSMANEPLSKVVSDLMNSSAGVANQIDDTYLQTVRRHATAAEIQTWTGPIQTGATTLDALAQRLLSSQEFYQLAYNTIQ